MYFIEHLSSFFDTVHNRATHEIRGSGQTSMLILVSTLLLLLLNAPAALVCAAHAAAAAAADADLICC
jgi:hypothetical protein